MNRLTQTATLILCVLCISPAFAGDSFVVGIGTSMNDSTGVGTALSWLGVKSVRMDVPWKLVEVSRGQYTMPAAIESRVNDATSRGIEPLLILAYGNPLYGNDKPTTPAAIAAYSRYAAFVVTHFRGRVRLFDLWNEWDAQTGRTKAGTPDTYVSMAKEAYAAIKAANPEAVVLSGGISGSGLAAGWLERFLQLGGLQYVDALSVHPYNFFSKVNTPEGAIAQLDRINELTRSVARDRQVRLYVTEMGYPTFAGKGGVADSAAAHDLTRFLELASMRDYIAGVWWYCLRDQGTDRANKEHHFGVMDAAMKPKPAAYALQAFQRRSKTPGAPSRLLTE
jgi:polysaccharide biosynthesis protein PslG